MTFNLRPLCRPVCWWHGCVCDWEHAQFDSQEYVWRVECLRCGAEQAPYQFDFGKERPEVLRLALRETAWKLGRVIFPTFPAACTECGHVGGCAADCDGELPF